MDLRVALVAQPVVAGVPVHVVHLARGLLSRGATLDVLCPPRSFTWSALAGAERVTLHPLGGSMRPSGSDARALAVLANLLREADVVHAHSSKAGALVRSIAIATRHARKVVFTPHAWSFQALDGVAARAAIAFERLAARGCARIITVSEAERRVGLDAGVGKASSYRVIRNGVDLAALDVERRPERGRVLMIARLARQKDPELAVRAFAAAAPAAGDGARLVIAGDGPLRAVTIDLAHELGVGDAVEVLGEADIPSELSRAECLLLTSAYEGCPLSVLEAQAAGVPVVATRVVGTEELIDDGVTGILTARTVDSVAGGLRSVFDGSIDAPALGAEARTHAMSNGGLERMVDETVAVYRELVVTNPDLS